MVSSYFAKPFGLHPTPSTCFPPPPPPPKLTYFAYFALGASTCQVNDNLGMSYWARDAIAPGSHTVVNTYQGAGSATYTTPIQDDGFDWGGTWIAPSTPGTYIVSMKFVWPDGTVIIYPFTIVVTP